MGLLDILNTLGGTSGDPHARPAPNQGTGQATSQGMSPMAKALLALLAIYAMKNMRRADSAPSQPAGRPGDVNAGLPGGGSSGDGLGDLGFARFSTHSAEPPGIRVLVFMLQMSSELPPPPEHAMLPASPTAVHSKPCQSNVLMAPPRCLALPRLVRPRR